MSNIQIEAAQPQHKEGGKLTYAAIDDMAEIILGTYKDKAIEANLQQLWENRANRFSHDISYVAIQNNEVLGEITCGPLTEIENRMTPTVFQIITMNKLKPFRSIFKHPKKFYSLVTMNEGKEGDYHISMLATMPNARGKGVAQKLLAFAENKAKEAGYNKISLTVFKDNDKALKLYKKQGFEIIGEINKKPFYLYQMRKNVN